MTRARAGGRGERRTPTSSTSCPPGGMDEGEDSGNGSERLNGAWSSRTRGGSTRAELELRGNDLGRSVWCARSL